MRVPDSIAGRLLAYSVSQRMLGGAIQRTVGPGAEIFSPNLPDESVVVGRSGEVKISKMLPDGRQQIVAVQKLPALLGRPFAPEHGVSVRALTTVDLYVLPRATLETFLDCNPAMLRELCIDLASQLDASRELLLAVGRKSARERVASFLDDLRVRHGSRGGDSLQLHLTRAEIADFLSLTVETVSRHLTALKREGVIELPNVRKLVIRDPERLRAATGNG